MEPGERSCDEDTGTQGYQEHALDNRQQTKPSLESHGLWVAASEMTALGEVTLCLHVPQMLGMGFEDLKLALLGLPLLSPTFVDRFPSLDLGSI